MKNVFNKEVSEELIERINSVSKDTKANWGKMNPSQMMAHLCVTYEYVYTDKYPKPKGFLKFILKTFIKKKVVSEKPFEKNGRTAPDFIMEDNKDFEKEKTRLIDFINKTQELGENYFEGKESHSFGVLTVKEWNNMFYKHLNHHLEQFGA